MKKANPTNLILETSLQGFFYQELQEINKNSTTPVPPEAIYYSSLVMESFETSENYFEKTEGKMREKILGVKLLEVNSLPQSQAKRSLKDVGDTALVLCGFFAESLNRKLIDVKYYQDIGKIAYSRLNSFVPTIYDVNSFYKLISTNFDMLTVLINLVSKKSKISGENNNYVLIDGNKKDEPS